MVSNRGKKKGEMILSSDVDKTTKDERVCFKKAIKTY